MLALVYHNNVYKISRKEVNMKRLLDTKQVAELLGKSEWWVRVNRENLAIPAFRVGSKLRFDEEEVIKWLDDQCRQ